MKVIFNCIFSFLFVCTFLDAAPFELESSTSLKYAQNALISSDYNDRGQLIIASGTDTLDFEFKAGFGLSNDMRYIRIDIINGAFNTNFPLTGIESNVSFDSKLVSGGAIGDQFMIVEVSAIPSVGPNTVFTLRNDSFLWFDDGRSLEIIYSLYDTATAAVNKQANLYSVQTVIANLVDAIGTNFTQFFTHKVGFGHDFLRFNPTFRSPFSFSLGDASQRTASLGKVEFDLLINDDVLLPSTSLSISDFRQLIPTVDTSKLHGTVKGDFSTAKFFLNQDDDCNGASIVLTEYSVERTINVSIDDLIGYPVFCMQAESNEIAIRRSEYQLDLGIGGKIALLGKVEYDAATIDLPYLTDFVNYKQRILLVNHAGYEVKYFTEFTAESSVMGNYTVLPASEGIIPAGETLKLNSTDIVSIDVGSPTRISARVFIDAKPQDISAAIQILSLGSSEPPQTNVLNVFEY